MGGECAVEVTVTRVKLAYGERNSQFGHVYLPKSPAPGPVPVIVLVHGGYWSTEFGLTIETAIARDLAARGAVVWNIEYRRVGEQGGGWPRTGNDVVAAISALDGPVRYALPETIATAADWSKVTVIGHSAGGQLAVWAVARLGAKTKKTIITTVIAQAAPLDLTEGGRVGRPSLRALMGASITQAPQLYRDASPAQLPPFPAHVVAIHGDLDESVPVAVSSHYVRGAVAAGQSAELIVVPDEGHDVFVNPRSRGHRETVRVLGI
jgi:acetyl esterase/lipase